MRIMQTIKWLTRWEQLKMQDDETPAEFAIRTANDGKVIVLWFVTAVLIIIGGLVYCGIK